MISWEADFIVNLSLFCNENTLKCSIITILQAWRKIKKIVGAISYYSCILLVSLSLSFHFDVPNFLQLHNLIYLSPCYSVNFTHTTLPHKKLSSLGQGGVQQKIIVMHQACIFLVEKLNQHPNFMSNSIQTST